MMKIVFAYVYVYMSRQFGGVYVLESVAKQFIMSRIKIIVNSIPGNEFAMDVNVYRQVAAYCYCTD